MAEGQDKASTAVKEAVDQSPLLASKEWFLTSQPKAAPKGGN